MGPKNIDLGLGQFQPCVHGAENGDAVGKGCSKDPQDDLLGPVSHEVADETRPVIGTRKGHRDNGDRKCHARDIKRGPGKRREDRTCAVHLGCANEARALDPV